MTTRALLRSLLVPTTLALGCLASEPPAVPLYPGNESTRLPPNQVADVTGPIGKIDGREVGSLGGRFDLLPGCHVVELDRQSDNGNSSLTGGIYLTGSGPITIYALRMQAGARYTIQRQTFVEGLGVPARMVLSAREELPGGAATDLVPAKSVDDLRACKAWGATLGH
ncbi:MAG TPA: hypothetical protein VH853_22630 [Polyangia bacterium]|jgi:hypothetical protein|nr:hypothetical protein [Polyangia bacterium]